jgi:hypothetical protein
MSKRLRQNGLAPNIITFMKVIAYGFLNDCMYHLVHNVTFYFKNKCAKIGFKKSYNITIFFFNINDKKIF